MSDDARLRAGRVPLGMLVGVPAMFVLGAAGGLLACVFGWFAGFGTGSEAAFAIVGALLAWGIAIPLWLRTRRYGRPCAVGLAVSWAAITLSFLAVAGDDG